MHYAMLLVPIWAALTHQTSLPDQRASISVSVPATVPSGASNTVDRGYPGLAFSSHSFSEYAGNASAPNTFSANLVDAISSRTGAPVHIRVGGTSGDFSIYNTTQHTAIQLSPGGTPGGIPHGIVIGNPWFEGFANFKNVKWTYMAHLANNSNGMMANSVAGVQEALKHIGDNLENIEIGNEIDYYPNVNRPGTYDNVDYLSDWNSYEDSIVRAVGNKTYQAPVYANNRCPFCIAGTFGKGQNSKGNVKAAALHHYIGGDAFDVSGVQANYMNHTRIVNKLNVFSEPIAWLKANQPDVPLYLAEVNSNTHSTDNYDVIGIFGSTLWLVDYMLYGLTLNIGRMNVQQSTGFSYSSWRGVEYNALPPAVLPPYYAHPFIADVISNRTDIRISSLPITSDIFSGYAIYDSASGKLTRVALINLQLYNSTTGGQRPSMTVDLDTNGAWSSSDTVKVEKLTARGAEIQDSSKISWKGLSWTYASGGKSYQTASTTQQIRCNQGKVAVTVEASEAVLLSV